MIVKLDEDREYVPRRVFEDIVESAPAGGLKDSGTWNLPVTARCIFGRRRG
ncbi:hypothetical protein [Micromonospora sp. NPDC000668]|uniref:hypothetical protein n=1 Tax=Micromonospora sp. NPDC000668 TaxID=3364219 RepID=UPI00367AFDBE